MINKYFVYIELIPRNENKVLKGTFIAYAENSDEAIKQIKEAFALKDYRAAAINISYEIKLHVRQIDGDKFERVEVI